MGQHFEASIAAATADLRIARDALTEEIKAYPTPVAGCDVQYNHLLAERRKVIEALRALGAEVFIPTPRTLFPGAGIESR